MPAVGSGVVGGRGNCPTWEQDGASTGNCPTWETQDGAKRSKVGVIVESFQFIDSKPAGGGEEKPKATMIQHDSSQDVAAPSALQEEDVPF